MRRASLLSRLAFALFAALGFVAPAAQPEPDCAVQVTSGASRPAGVAAKVEVETKAAPISSGALLVEPRVVVASAAPGERRYLLNRAWLL